MGLWVPAILLRRSLIILGGASPTHPAREGDEWKGEGRGDSREHDGGWRRSGWEEKRMGGQTIVIDRRQQEREIVEGENKTGEMREGEFHGYIYSRFPLRVLCPPRSDTAVGAHFGSAGQGPEMDPQKVR
jgi:hypothetical protein